MALKEVGNEVWADHDLDGMEWVEHGVHVVREWVGQEVWT